MEKERQVEELPPAGRPAPEAELRKRWKKVKGFPWDLLPMLVVVLAMGVTRVPGVVAVLGALRADLVAVGFVSGCYILLRQKRQLAQFWLFALLAVWMSVLYAQALWGSADAHFQLAGALPHSDASWYATDAVNLTLRQSFSEVGSWRPISHAINGVLFRLTNYSSLSVGGIWAALFAAALFSMVTVLARATRPLLAVVFLLAAGPCIASTLGTFMTETSGFVFGCVGAAFVIEGAQNGCRRRFLCGLGLLSLALAARAGAMFVLPMLGLAYAAGELSWSKRFQTLALLAAAVAGVFAMNAMLARTVGGEGTGFGNFRYTFHGLVTGEGWAAATRLPADEVWTDALDRLRDDPLALPRNAVRAVYIFFRHNVVFHFAGPRLFQHLLLLGWVVAMLLSAFRWRRNRLSAVLLAGGIGIVLSMPFAPPWDAGIRPYAATIPLQVATALIGFRWAVELILKRLRPHWIGDAAPLARSGFAPGPLAWTAFALLLSVVAPIYVFSSGGGYSDPRGTLSQPIIRPFPGNYREIGDGVWPRITSESLAKLLQPIQREAPGIYERLVNLPQGTIITTNLQAGAFYATPWEATRKPGLSAPLRYIPVKDGALTLYLHPSLVMPPAVAVQKKS